MRTVQQLFAFALERQRSGDRDAAQRAYAEVLEQHPGHVDSLHMAGLLHHQSGAHEQALTLLDAAHAAAPDNAPILAHRASVQLALGRTAAAEFDARAALARDGDSYAATFNLGLALVASARLAEAAEAFERASALRPQQARALLEWFLAAAQSDRTSGLAARVRAPLPALAAERDLALRAAMELERHGFSNQAFAVLAQLRGELPQDAEIAYRYDVEARYRYAVASEYRNASAAALAAADALIGVAPWHCGVRRLRASLLGERGRAAEALAECALVVERSPGDAASASAWLIALQHDPARSAAEIAAAHREWASVHTPSIAARWAAADRDADPERRLRIGWLSPRFFAGLAETFFAAELEQLDRTRMMHVLYDSSGIDDAATARFRAGADLWRRVAALDDAALCAQIRADEIDVLVELSGHGPGNRLRALAARPAPVQVTWLDYFHSTGMPAIDFLISDRVLSPPELLGNYSERVLYLASGRLSYSPPVGAPAVMARTDGALRLACFNRLSKVNDAVLDAWSRILGALPRATLKLKMRAFDDAGHRDDFLARAASRGLGAERLELSGYGTHLDALAAYGDVDIALDPLPFSGCATSCDALWMGVPVVTHRGETMVGRQTASLLTALDLTDLIAHDGADYVDRVLALAADHERRRTLRFDLRNRMRSTIAAIDRHAIELATQLRAAWRCWCRGELSGSATRPARDAGR